MRIAIKVSIPKMSVGGPYADFVAACFVQSRFALLPIEPRHLAEVAALPYPSSHRDPFDCILAFQSRTGGVEIVSADAALDQYGVARLW